MKKMQFKIFNDERLGHLFTPDGLSYDDINAICISPIHGRAIAIQIDGYEWLTVKGGGWNYGGPQIYISMKDEELVFGLYPFASAERELAVSREIEKISDRFPKVLYYKKLLDIDLPQKYDFIKDIKFSNGRAVDPCILYTKLKCPYRVSDLMYFNEAERLDAIKYCCDYWGVPTDEYINKFTRALAENVAILHKNGFINDTLDYGNVTMLSELVDYEWVTAPGIKLFDGTYGLEITEERKEKEILYGSEICLQLTALLHKEGNLFDIYNKFVESYSRINPEFVNNNCRIQKILNKEAFIL